MPFSSHSVNCAVCIPEVLSQSTQTAVPPTCNSCTPTTKHGWEEQVKENRKAAGVPHFAVYPLARGKFHPFGEYALYGELVADRECSFALISYKPPTAFLCSTITYTKTVFSKLTSS